MPPRLLPIDEQRRGAPPGCVKRQQCLPGAEPQLPLDHLLLLYLFERYKDSRLPRVKERVRRNRRKACPNGPTVFGPSEGDLKLQRACQKPVIICGSHPRMAQRIPKQRNPSRCRSHSHPHTASAEQLPCTVPRGTLFWVVRALKRKHSLCTLGETTGKTRHTATKG